MHMLYVCEDLHTLKMRILKGYVIPSPVTYISFILNMITILIIKYIVLNFDQM